MGIRGEGSVNYIRFLFAYGDSRGFTGSLSRVRSRLRSKLHRLARIYFQEFQEDIRGGPTCRGSSSQCSFFSRTRTNFCTRFPLSTSPV